ncbi:MAG: FG-GAP repeat domain-containing protein, partial [Gemmataceae bacterium]
KDDIANFHPSNGNWWVSIAKDTGDGFTTTLWADFATNSGWTSQLVGDFNDDGKDDIANFHPSNGNWWVSLSTGSAFTTTLWADFATNSGWSQQIVGDFNGDDRDDIANFHPSNGNWWVSLARPEGGFQTTLWASFVTRTGWTSQLAGDFSGDGRDDIANFHPSNSTWWVSVAQFGAGAESALDAGGLEDPDAFGVRDEIPVLERLARFEPGSTPFAPSVSQWVTVSADDPNLAGKNIYFIAHGWAPGFLNMVQANSTPGDPLKWWETLDTSLPMSPGTPASPELFYAEEADGVVVSPVGLALAILAADPDAVVVAYSWIDESATADVLDDTIPAGAFLSEAYTYMNGLRLARAIVQSVGAANVTSAKLHLIGHSHGSKVVSVATLALHQGGAGVGLPGGTHVDVDHLTVLDSPEGAETSLVDATNFNWFFLGGANIGRTAGTTFIDNYISQFDEAYGTIQGVNPFDPSTQVNNLQDVVDVTLNPLLYGILDLGGRHGYSFSWYGGASFDWAQNPSADLADQWSPLLGFDPSTLAGSFTQTWTAKNQNQFQLTPGPTNNTVQDTATFTNISFSDTTISSGSTFSGGTITLNENSDGSTATFTGEFRPELEIRGVSFQFNFSNVGDGDQLVVSVDTGTAFAQQIHFVLTGTVAGNGVPQTATLSLGSLAPSIFKHTIQVQLVSTGNQNASVQLSNFQQFEF